MFRNVDMNTINKHNNSPLNTLCILGNTKLARKLIKKDGKKLMKHNLSLMKYYANEHGDFKLLKLLKEFKE